MNLIKIKKELIKSEEKVRALLTLSLDDTKKIESYIFKIRNTTPKSNDIKIISCAIFPNDTKNRMELEREINILILEYKSLFNTFLQNL